MISVFDHLLAIEKTTDSIDPSLSRRPTYAHIQAALAKNKTLPFSSVTDFSGESIPFRHRVTLATCLFDWSLRTR